MRQKVALALVIPLLFLVVCKADHDDGDGKGPETGKDDGQRGKEHGEGGENAQDDGHQNEDVRDKHVDKKKDHCYWEEVDHHDYYGHDHCYTKAYKKAIKYLLNKNIIKDSKIYVNKAWIKECEHYYYYKYIIKAYSKKYHKYVKYKVLVKCEYNHKKHECYCYVQDWDYY
jgi:hypothetical protein